MRLIILTVALLLALIALGFGLLSRPTDGGLPGDYPPVESAK